MIGDARRKKVTNSRVEYRPTLNRRLKDLASRSSTGLHSCSVEKNTLILVLFLNDNLLIDLVSFLPVNYVPGSSWRNPACRLPFKKCLSFSTISASSFEKFAGNSRDTPIPGYLVRSSTPYLGHLGDPKMNHCKEDYYISSSESDETEGLEPASEAIYSEPFDPERNKPGAKPKPRCRIITNVKAYYDRIR